VDPCAIEPRPHRRRLWRPWRRRTDLTALDAFPPRIPDGDTVLRPGQRRYADILNDPQAQTQAIPIIDQTNLVRGHVNAAEQGEARRRWRQ
jgi:hypothetical protein